MPHSRGAAWAPHREPPGEEASGAGGYGCTGSDRNEAVGARNTSAFPIFSKTIKWEHSRRTHVAPGDTEIGDPRRHHDSPPALHPPHPEGTGTRRGALPPQPSPNPPGGPSRRLGRGRGGQPPAGSLPSTWASLAAPARAPPPPPWCQQQRQQQQHRASPYPAAAAAAAAPMAPRSPGPGPGPGPAARSAGVGAGAGAGEGGGAAPWAAPS